MEIIFEVGGVFMEFFIAGLHDLYVTKASYIKEKMKGLNLGIETSIKCYICMMTASIQSLWEAEGFSTGVWIILALGS